MTNGLVRRTVLQKETEVANYINKQAFDLLFRIEKTGATYEEMATELKKHVMILNFYNWKYKGNYRKKHFELIVIEVLSMLEILQKHERQVKPNDTRRTASLPRSFQRHHEIANKDPSIKAGNTHGRHGMDLSHSDFERSGV